MLSFQSSQQGVVWFMGKMPLGPSLLPWSVTFDNHSNHFSLKRVLVNVSKSFLPNFVSKSFGQKSKHPPKINPAWKHFPNLQITNWHWIDTISFRIEIWMKKEWLEGYSRKWSRCWQSQHLLLSWVNYWKRDYRGNAGGRVSLLSESPRMMVFAPIQYTISYVVIRRSFTFPCIALSHS